MTSRGAVVLVVSGLLALPAAAAAKGRAEAQICGATGCTVVTAPGKVHPLTSTGSPTRAPSPAPFYTVTVTFEAPEDPETYRMLYVPSRGAWKGIDLQGERHVWTEIPSVITSTLEEATEAIEPFPASAEWETSAPQSSSSSRPWIPLSIGAGVVAVALGVLRRLSRGAARGPIAT